MSEHAQALMISTRVHALFGYTLGLAGVTRIIEICFFVPTFANSGVGGSALVPDDSNSDHTLADASLSPREPYAPTADSVIIEAKEDKSAAGKVFRHLPPFVSSFEILFFTQKYSIFYSSVQLLVSAGYLSIC